ncbi:MAG: GYD domain-containing protein [Actinomycetota bacterium]
MPKYMYKVSYSVDGMRGVTKEGAASRAGFIEKLIANLGGKMESFHFAFGPTDVYVISELPDDATAAALAMAVGASGVGSIETVKLLTPEEADAARAIDTGYRAPGS